ncbi:hypothetical protein [Pedobacter sp.]
MKLTKIQLEKIRIYLDENGFKYLDIQMEILDHIASAVEEKMTEDPTLTFEDAVNQTRISFGKAGFINIEKSIVKGLSNRYRKLFFRHFFSLFGIRFIWMPFLLVFGLYQLQNIISNKDNLFTAVIIVYILVFLVMAYRSLKSAAYRKYMVYKVSGGYMGYLGLFLMMVFQSINYSSTDKLFGLDRSYLMVSILGALFVMYYIAALKTEKAGILESKAMADKLQLI